MEVNNYDRDYNLLEMPTFKFPVRKIPEDNNREAKLDLVRDSIEKIERSLQPAEPHKIKEQLGRLMLHKGIGNYNEGQWKVLVNDYVKFLGKYPLDLIERACEECICDPNMRFFPQVGILINKMGRDVALRCLYLERLRKVLEISTIELREFEPKLNPNPVEFGSGLANKFKM